MARLSGLHFGKKFVNGQVIMRDDHVDNSDDGGCGDHHEGNDYYCHDENGRFFPTHVTLQSHEDTRAYANVYNYVKEGLGGQAPEKWMADAAKEITAAGEEVNIIEFNIFTL